MKKFMKTLSILSIAAVILLVASMIIISIINNGLGLFSYFDPNGEFHLGKTFWDWLDLIVVPISLAIIAYLFSRSEKRREAEFELDRMREKALQDYFDHIEKLITEGLKTSKADDVKRGISRSRTITTLRILDGKRKGLLLQFLYEAGLIYKSQSEEDINPIISLHGADLRGTDLSNSVFHSAIYDKHSKPIYGFRMENINLAGVDLSESNVSGILFWNANFNSSNLSYSNLRNTSFYQADLHDVDMSSADLSEAALFETNFPHVNFSGANLTNASCTLSDFIGTPDCGNNGHYQTPEPFKGYTNFSHANLSGVTFEGARILPEQFKVAKSLRMTILPNESNYNGKYALFTMKSTSIPITDEGERILSGSDLGWIMHAYCICGHEIENIYHDQSILGFWYGLIKHRIKCHRHKIDYCYKVGGKVYHREYKKNFLNE